MRIDPLMSLLTHMKTQERKMMTAWEAIEKRKEPVALRKPA